MASVQKLAHISNYNFRQYGFYITFVCSSKNSPLPKAFYSTSQQGAANVNVMANWHEEKKKYLQMSLHDKRKEYSCGENFVSVEDIPTWDDYILKKKTTPKKSPMPADFSINSMKNSKLAKKISIFRGDITTLEVDAIVNAANRSLLGGGGVDGAIHRAAGPFLVAENQTHGGCNVGEVKLSGGYQLPARFIISTVGPQGEKPDLLRKCYKNSLECLLKQNLKTIAFPSISTGIYGYPLRPAAHVSAQEVRKVLEQSEDKIDRVIFCLFSEVDEDTYLQVLPTYFPLQ